MKFLIVIILFCSLSLVCAVPSVPADPGAQHTKTEGSIDPLLELYKEIESGNIERIRELANDKTVKLTDESGNTALHVAVEKGDRKIVDLLIQKGADIDAANKYGHTPLHIAALSKDKSITELLIQHGANVFKTDVFGYSPVYLAALNSDEKIIEMFIKSGVKVNELVTNDTTILHFAAVNMNEKVVEVLIENGANINLVNKMKQTPLHVAALNSNPKIADLLVKSGANVNALDKDEREALYHTVFNGNAKSKLEVQETTAEQKSYTKRKCYEELLKHYTHPIQKNAAEKIAELLINNGAKINRLDSMGKTAYDAAISYDNERMKDILTKFGGKTAKDINVSE